MQLAAAGHDVTVLDRYAAPPSTDDDDIRDRFADYRERLDLR